MLKENRKAELNLALILLTKNKDKSKTKTILRWQLDVQTKHLICTQYILITVVIKYVYTHSHAFIYTTIT